MVVSTVNVLVTYPMKEVTLLDRVRAMDKTVLVSVFPYTESLEERMARRMRKFELLGPSTKVLPQQFLDFLQETEVILCMDLPTEVVSKAPKLKWVQLIGAGADFLPGTGVLESPVLLTNMAGLSSRPIAEYVLGVMTMHSKQLMKYVCQMQHRDWNRLEGSELRGKTVGIVGLGHIGSEVASLCKAFGMTVLATKNNVGSEAPSNVDRVFRPAELKTMLGLCDFVVVSVALTPETRELIGEAEFKAMKPSAFFVNVARGLVVDQNAMVRALGERWIGGAALDVSVPEPLPKESPLWELPNTLVTPHCSAIYAGNKERLIDAFCENLRRYLNGQQLLNVVDKGRGY